jgi:CelD/BcsL family acetyltransferase involved in cellulose biosynthesis
MLDSFYSLHLATRRRQGVPIQPRRFFQLLWDRVLARGGGELLVAEAGGHALAAAVFLRRGGRIVYKFGASDSSSWDLRPNHAIFWEAIRAGCETGAEELDFGRTDLGNDGLRAFKAGWGTVERPLVYTFVGAQPRGGGSGTAHRALGAVIRRSPPAVCRVLGERLYRYAS